MADPRLIVVCGPMFAGKTEELLRRVRRAHHAEMGVQIFSPSTDTRRQGRLVSHAGTALEDQNLPITATVVEPEDAFSSRVRPNVSFVALDEVQFFAPSALHEVLKLVNERRVTVFAAGLDKDSTGRPFGIVPTLLAHADEVLKLTAICAACRRDATMTYRHGSSQEQIYVGAEQEYAAMCRPCWLKASAPKSKLRALSP